MANHFSFLKLGMFVCMFICIHVCTYLCMYECICTHTHAHIYAHTHTHTLMHAYSVYRIILYNLGKTKYYQIKFVLHV